MSEFAVPPPSAIDGTSLADWAEAALLAEGRKRLSRSGLRQRFSSSLGEDDVDFAIDLLMQEVSRRDEVIGSNYPFAETESGVARKDVASGLVYEFLLLLAVSPRFRAEGRYQEIDELFDEVTKHSLKAYGGPEARGIRFAFPSNDGRPEGFPDAVVWLADMLNLAVGSANPRPAVKDGGVDVVVWRPFRDGRSGFLVILCQCTVQRDWTAKAKDIVADKWRGWIDLGRDPMTALSVPFAVPPGYDRWDEVRRTVTMLLDRLRLCELFADEGFARLEEIRVWSVAEWALLSTA